MARSYPERDIKLLWGLAAARCSFESCRAECVESATTCDRAVVLGKIAHIIAHSDEGPRADKTVPADQRDKYENWILLCGRHHDIVDGQASTYTIAQLRAMKDSHERWVREQLAIELPGIGFAELEVVTKAMLAPVNHDGGSLTVTPPREKISRNGLGDSSTLLITMGLAKAKEVGKFVENVAKLSPSFPNALKTGFLNKYVLLMDSGLQGDGLFQGMCDFSAGGSRDWPRKAAGLAVVAYLFEKCEIFEQ